MHGAFFRPVYGVGQSSHTRNRIGKLQYDVQQRILEAARFWLDVDSAVSKVGAFEELLKGKAGYSTAGLTTMAPYEYSAVSLPSGVLDAPFLKDMLQLQAKQFLLEYDTRMLRSPTEVSVNKETF